ncbi:hypothetical protein PILCRDRAFT_85206 [Piloderma croceum F 1598]|uniref:Uncharacterized protein n=1 Tax=Piloderma croceum (strain F 1598) TaxID=765440 RepID=A0A0C3CFY8_PILCF|nr:hypothetical protein PILCRDRAFT_85206 [Piloderma croceum F 1598]
MLSLRTFGIEWSLGSRPYWELDNDDDESNDADEESELKSVADSLVILQSLRQSREKWLTSTFPKFSSKSRGGKPAQVVPPPHTIHNRGKCEIEIGPHTFPNTVIFEVHYQYLQPPASKPMYIYQPPTPGQTSSWQTTTPYGAVSYTPYSQRQSEPLSASQVATPPAPADAAASQKSSAPLLSSLDSSVSITSALISQVNAAATSNPTLANLLQQAASGKATPEQLKTLGLLIQSLASFETMSDTPGTASASGTPQPDATSKRSTPALAPPSQSPTCISAPKGPTLHPAFAPSKDFDLVLEFAENPFDRWILPRAPVIIESIPGGASADDILLTAGVPFARSPLPGSEKEMTDTTAEDVPQELVTFRFVKASSDIWSCVSRWAGAQEKMDITRKAFEHLLEKEPDKVYLAHQLPEGALLSQIQNSAMPPYTMKSIRPTQADTTKPKRARKPAAPKPVAAKHAMDTPTSSVGALQPKRKRQSKAVLALPKIACVACGQTDVPLIMGGRYCRPCAGPEPQTYPGTPQNGGTFMHKFWAGPNSGQTLLHWQYTPQPLINLQPAINPQPAISPQPAINSSQPAEPQQPLTAPTVSKRKKLSVNETPAASSSSHPIQVQQPSSSKKKKSK